MKKIYSVALILLALWLPSANAQCPPGPSVARPYVVPDGSGGKICQVFAINMPPNALIRVINAANVDITLNNPDGSIPRTDATGAGFPYYDCNSSPSYVITLAPSCRAEVLALIDLPIKVKDFNAQAQNDNSVLLRWVSTFEFSSYQYVIQRSNDGRTFTDIGNLQAAGNSAVTINYSFSDRQMLNGAAYYRLKLVDLDGTFDYTKIIYINNGVATFTNFSVFPNPFRSEVQLKGVTTADVNRKNIKVYNTMGSEVNYRVVGGNSIVIDPSVPKGVYILRVKGQAYKLFKE